jgi:xylan 1,4-beta-xylosidase
MEGESVPEHRTPLVRRAILGGLVCAALILTWSLARVTVVAAGSKRSAPRPATFCNPIDLEDRLGVAVPQPPEPSLPKAADPTILFFKGEYWLFTSARGTYWRSPDLVAWQQVQAKGLPAVDGTPALVVLNGCLHWLGNGTPGLYATADPGQGEWALAADTAAYADPTLFLDDDGRLYLYSGSAENGPISAVELDPKDGFKVVHGPVACISGDAARRGWEVYGEDNRGAPYRGRMRFDPWISGAAMTKHAGRYYLQYAAPAADAATSASGVFVADSPLGPFAYARYSPFSRKPAGFVSGAGHGRIFLDADGRPWYAASVAVSAREGAARRLALYPAGFLTDGQLVADTYLGDYPQYVPGVASDPLRGNSPGWMLLSREKRAEASSTQDGFPAENAFDENVRTQWSAASGAAGEWLRVDLGKRCRIDALQVSFADPDPAAEGGARGETYQYAAETSEDGEKWSPLFDRRDAARTSPNDYVQLERPVVERYVRLVNVRMPGGRRFAVSELRVFGSGMGAPPSQVRGVAAARDATDPRHVRISWAPAKGATFHVVRYGIAADRLLNNYQVYDANDLDIASLNAGVPYFVGIDAVNDSGATRAKTVVSVK